MRKIFLFDITASFALAAALLTPHTAAQALPTVGQAAPAFTLTSQSGTPVSLASMHGKWVVVFFYPAATEEDSADEAQSFQDDLPDYEEKDSVVVGISLDTPQAQKAFAAQAGISFALLSDPNGSVAKSYGSLGTLNGAPAANRNTFLID